jgi:hypothetical protein
MLGAKPLIMGPLSLVDVPGPNVNQCAWSLLQFEPTVDRHPVTVFDPLGRANQPECTACPLDTPGLVFGVEMRQIYEPQILVLYQGGCK